MTVYWFVEITVILSIFFGTLYYNFTTLVPRKLSKLIELQVSLTEIKYRLNDFKEEFRDLTYLQENPVKASEFTIEFKEQNQHLILVLIQIRADAAEIDKKTYKAFTSLLSKYLNLSKTRFIDDVDPNDLDNEVNQNQETMFNLLNQYARLLDETEDISTLLRKKVKSYEKWLLF